MASSAPSTTAGAATSTAALPFPAPLFGAACSPALVTSSAPPGFFGSVSSPAAVTSSAPPGFFGAASSPAASPCSAPPGFFGSVSSPAAVTSSAPPGFFGSVSSPAAVTSSAPPGFFGAASSPAAVTSSVPPGFFGVAPSRAAPPGFFGAVPSQRSPCPFGCGVSPVPPSSAFGSASTSAFGLRPTGSTPVESSPFGAPAAFVSNFPATPSGLVPSPNPFGNIAASSSGFGPSPNPFVCIPATTSGLGPSPNPFVCNPATTSGLGSSPFVNPPAQPFGGRTGEAFDPYPCTAPYGTVQPGWAVDRDSGHNLSVALGLKDSHEELRWRYDHDRMKEMTKKSVVSGNTVTKNITISLEDRPKPNSNVMTAPLFTDAEQKLPIQDGVAKYSFMMGEHKVTIQIDGPVSDGAAAKVEALLPKLSNVEYFTVPTIQELAYREKLEPGYLSRVRDFTVGRHGYGSIMFPDETDVRGLELSSIVQFKSKEVVLYPDGKTPPAGVELNKLGVVTLENVKYYDEKGEQFRDGPIVEKIKDLLMKTASENEAEFLSYDAASGVWKFAIKKH